jgi:proline/betaine transport protein TphA
MCIAYALSIFEITAFCVLTTVPVFYYETIFQLSKNQVLLMNVLILFACTILPPIIGKIAQRGAERNHTIPWMEISAWGSIFFTPFLVYSVAIGNLFYTMVFNAIFVLLLSIQFALLPSLIANIFPTAIRYTGIGFTFNVCDGILWALLPILIASWVYKTENVASVFLLLPLTATMFLIAYHYWKKEQKADFIY